jgi:hypothetical protein
LGAGLGLLAQDAGASSHREAPFITRHPKVDGTDFYMFQSYETGRTGFTTIIANYQPLEDAYGGPNYFTMDPDALYEIHIDNTGDAIEDITFQFRFANKLADQTGAVGFLLPVPGTTTKMNSVPVVTLNVTGDATGNGPGVFPIDNTTEDKATNVHETYQIGVVKGPRRMTAPVMLSNGTSMDFRKPLDYVGSKVLGNAAAYAAYSTVPHTYDLDLSSALPGCSTKGKVFVGQRQEGFKVNLGLIFDLVNAPIGAILDLTQRDVLGGAGPGNGYVYDNTATKNVTTIALELPTSCITSQGESVIGGWTTASLRQARVINPKATYDKPSVEGGAWAQGSRLGMPLTNEVVIGLKDKDRFNSSEPIDDAQFADYVTNATLPQLLQLIFGKANAPFPQVQRDDLVTLFLTGVPGVNKFTKNMTPATAEMLRLNTGLPVTIPANQSPLGAALCFPGSSDTTNCMQDTDSTKPGYCFKPDLTGNGTGPLACDAAGFPNGRRPGDDIVDIELTSVLGYFVPNAPAAPGKGMHGTPLKQDNILHDGIAQAASQFDSKFPYMLPPHSGDVGFPAKP